MATSKVAKDFGIFRVLILCSSGSRDARKLGGKTQERASTKYPIVVLLQIGKYNVFERHTSDKDTARLVVILTSQ